MFSSIYICTEIMQADLHVALRHWRLRDSKELFAQLLYQLLRALQYMHESGLMHRDVKPGNIMVDLQGNLKLGDFGLSKFICGKINEDYDLTDFVVTRWYRPPELTMRYSNEKYDEKIDMWSVGCVAYEMLTQQILF